ncbi:TAP42-like protein [Chytriomyces sp. MP71]|nr:TAP42-like protein [Chytriomyces sp. MP71]
MATTTPEDTSLSAHFEAAQALYKRIEDSALGCACEEYQLLVSRCIKMLSECADMVSQLRIFSDNEFVDDMNATDLRFLLLDFYAGMLATKVVVQKGTGVDKTLFRVDSLNNALKHFEAFLLTLDTHDALPQNSKKYLNAEALVLPKDPAALRALKIDTFKREKALKIRLQELQAQMDAAQNDSSIGKDGDGADDLDLRDSEAYRESMTTTIELCVAKTVDEMRMARDELALLNQAVKMEQQLIQYTSSRSDSTLDNNAADTLDDLSRLRIKPDSLLSREGKPRQPFIITNKREEFQKGVFRPGHNLPTMTVDEFLENQMKQGAIISGGGKMPEKILSEDKDDEQSDLETLKARVWDEFKDDNPTGWGNRMNKG